MKRRRFFAFLLMIPATIRFAIDHKWGRMDPARHFTLRQRNIWLRVFLGDEDVTDRCVLANDRLGYVVLNKLRDGKPYLRKNKKEIAREVKRGSVEFRRVRAWA